MAVTNIWNILNLRESPFFQDPLDPSTGGHYPLRLFVGRKREAEHILRGLGSAPHSRHAVQGPPGVGKTTLVQYVKAAAAESGWLAESEAIPVTSAATAEDLLLKVLGSVHDALGARDETLLNLDAMQDVRQLLDVERARSYSVTASLVGAGGVGGGGAPHRFTGPGALAVQPARLLRDLSAIAHDHLQAPGILIHLDNLENVAEPDQARAAQIIRDLRDSALMHAGFHYILVGTDDAIRTIISSQEQLRSVFSNPGSLQPLGESELHELLERRYEYLAVSGERPHGIAVTREAVGRLYRLFQGNLRGTLHGLDEAAKVLVGRGEDPMAPMDFQRMAPVLRAIYQAKLQSDLTQTQAEHLRRIAAHDVDASLTQAEAGRRLGLNATSTSTLFSDLQRKGYLVETSTLPTGRRGRPRQQYVLTGPTRLALDAAATETNP